MVMMADNWHIESDCAIERVTGNGYQQDMIKGQVVMLAKFPIGCAFRPLDPRSHLKYSLLLAIASPSQGYRLFVTSYQSYSSNQHVILFVSKEVSVFLFAEKEPKMALWWKKRFYLEMDHGLVSLAANSFQSNGASATDLISDEPKQMAHLCFH